MRMLNLPLELCCHFFELFANLTLIFFTSSSTFPKKLQSFQLLHVQTLEPQFYYLFFKKKIICLISLIFIG